MKQLKIKQKSNYTGFTLVELVIVIAIVIILSVVSVPIYRNYVDKAKWSEGYALLGTIMSAEKSYYSEYGNFYSNKLVFTDYDSVLGIDVRGNKYFTSFETGKDNLNNEYVAVAWIPIELRIGGNRFIYSKFNVTAGYTLFEAAL